MVSTRRHISQTSKTPEVRIRGRIFSSFALAATPVLVTARSVDQSQLPRRYPFVEAFLSEAQLQPYVHNCIMSVKHRRETIKYMVFFKRHYGLRANSSIQKVSMLGDVLVLRMGKAGPERYVNLRGSKDNRLVDRYLAKFANHIALYMGRNNKRRLPSIVRL